MSSTGKVTRTRAAIALAGVALIGVGGIASTASLNQTATVTATAEMASVSLDVDGQGTVELEKLSGDRFMPGEPRTDSFAVNYTGDTAATIELAPAGEGDLAPYFEVEILDESGQVVVPATTLDQLDDWSYSVTGADSREFTVDFQLSYDLPAHVAGTGDLTIDVTASAGA